MSTAGHRQIEHTADLALEIWGPDESGMLEAGARAVVGLLTDGAAVSEFASRPIRLEAVDAEDRVVRWLGEVLYWASVEGFLVARAELHVDDEQGLRGTAWGELEGSSKLRTEIKAATYHDLVVRREADRVVARVVLDV